MVINLSNSYLGSVISLRNNHQHALSAGIESLLGRFRL